MLKKFFAGFGLLSLMVSPLLAAADATGPAPAAAEAAPAAAAAVKPVVAKKEYDEAGVKAGFEKFSQAWAAGDAKGRAALFTADATLINPFGVSAKGRAEIEKVFEQENSTIAKGTTHVFDNFQIHFVMPNFALVDVDGTISGVKTPAGVAAPDVKLHAYCVVVNRGKGWLVYAARPTIYPPKPGTAAADVSAPPAAADEALPGDKKDKK